MSVSRGAPDEFLEVILLPPAFLAAVLQAGDWLDLDQRVHGGMFHDGHISWSMTAAWTSEIIMENREGLAQTWKPQGKRRPMNHTFNHAGILCLFKRLS